MEPRTDTPEVHILGDGQHQGLEISVNGVMEAYRSGASLAIHASTWRLNPKVTRATYAKAYADNPILAERDYGAIAPRTVEAAIRDKKSLEEMAVKRPSALDELGAMHDWFVPDPKFEYYLHADLSKNRDNTAIAMCHYDPDTGMVFVDFIYTIRNMKNWTLSFTRVEEYILQLNTRGFRLNCSFDGWNSAYLMERLTNTDIKVQLYSVDRGLEAYDTLISALYSGRVDFPYNDDFIRELSALKLYGGTKYDHPALGSKDTSDSVAGSVSRCYKSLVGSLMSQTEVDSVLEETGALDVVLIPEQHAWVFRGSKLDIRTRFGVRIDAVDDQLVVQVGHQDRQSGMMLVDGFYLWDQWNMSDQGCDAILQFLEVMHRQIEIFAFSMNESVPMEIVQFIQMTGKRFVSALAARRGTNGQLIRSNVITRKAINTMIQQVKKGAIRIPPVPELVRDLHYITDTNQMERKFVLCLAGFCDFMLKQHAVGHEGRPMPDAQSTQYAPGRSAGAPRLSQAGVLGDGSDIDKIRRRTGAFIGIGANQQPTVSGRRTFPKPLRGR